MEVADLFAVSGEMGALMRTLDWAATPIGAIESWPPSLQNALSIGLTSDVPIAILWGPEFIQFYNNAYCLMLGLKKHPQALGQPVDRCLASIWPQIGPVIESVWSTGRASGVDNQPLEVDRNGYLEECYFNLSYSPIFDETGNVAGIFNVIIETTQQIISDRRLHTLRELAVKTDEAQTIEEGCRIAIASLCENPADIPFALLYQMEADRNAAYLSAIAGIEAGTAASPLYVDLAHPEGETGFLARVANTGQAAIVDRVDIGNSRDKSPHSAIVLPIAAPEQKQPSIGMLVLGISPRRAFDEEYRRFFDLVATHVKTAIANARSRERQATETPVPDRRSHFSEERFRGIVDAIPQIVWICKPDGEVEYFNQQALHAFGITQEQLDSASWYRQVHPDDLQQTVDRWMEAIATGDCYQIECRLRLVDDTYRWHLARGIPQRDETGKITRWFVTCTDIDDLKQVQRRQVAQYAVTRVLAEATTLTDAVPAILQSLCESLGWQLGIVWRVEHCTHVMHYVNSWRSIGLDEEFVKVSERITFAAGVGLPGRIWISRQPTWISDLSQDSNFPRAALALQGGLHAAFGFPIVLGHEIVGAIECFSDRIREPDTDLLDLMAAIGSAIGQFMERKRTEEALRESQQLFQAFMDNSPMSAFIKDEAGRYLYVNTVVERLFHRQPADCIGKTDLDLFPTEVAQQVRKNDRAVLAGSEAVSLVEIAPLADGEHHYLSFKFPLQDPSGRSLLAGMSIDITDRIRAEEALRASAERLSLALAAAKMGDWSWDDVTDVVTLSERAAEIFGIPSRLYMTRTQMGDLLHEKDRERSRVALEQSVRDRSNYDIEYRIVRPDGIERWVAAKGRFQYDASGRVLGMQGTIQDISDRKLAEAEKQHLLEQVRLEQELLKAVLQQLPAGAIVAEAPSGNIILRNEQIQQIWQSAELLPVDNIHWGFHPDGRVYQPHEWPLWRSVKTGEIVKDEEIDFIREDGTLGVVLVNSAPVYDDRGQITAGVATFYDITARKRTEAELREREKRFSTLFNGMDDWVLVYHLTPDGRPGRLIEINEQACKKLGYSRKELLTMSVTDIIGSHSVNPKGNLETLVMSKHVVIESVHTTKDGRCIPVEVNATLFTLNGLPTVQSICRDITQRKQAEEALRKSERLYRAIGETIDYGIWVCEPDGRNVYASESFLRLVGLTQEQCSNFGWGDVLHPDDAERTIAAWKECVRTGSIWDIEHRFRGVDGNWHPILARGVPVRDESGAIACWAGINLDISRLKQVEAQLRESEARFRSLADSAPVPIWVNDADGGCEFVNQEYLKFFGKTLEEVMGFGWQASVHPDDEAQYMSTYLAAFKAREPFRAQVRVKRADDRYRWLDSYALPRFSPGGEFLGYIGTSPDITEIKEASEALRQSEERFQLAARAVVGVVYDWNIQTGQVYRSEGLYRVVGIRPEDIPQTQEWWDNRMHPDDRAEIEPLWQSTLVGRGDRYDFEYRVRHADGHWVDVWDRGYLIRDEGGQLVRVVGSSTDISDRKRSEAEREWLLDRERAAREEAEAANRIKDEFLAVLSHELRSPLNPILGWTRLLRTRKFDPQAADLALETIERNTRLLSQLIEDLLDVSRILRGKIALNVALVDLPVTIEAALETVCLAAQSKNIQIQTRFAPDVGLVSGDGARLQQIVWNLLSNAVKFTPAGGRVEIYLECDASDAQIIVRDTGKGIAPKFLPYVFDYFCQEDGKTTRQFGGLGLGLAIVRYLTELHGGTVRAESPGEGLGATFTVRLPLLAGNRELEVESREIDFDRVHSTPDMPLAGVRILVVDDEADMRELAIAILQEAGARVSVAASAVEALSLLDRGSFDISISDIGMPDIDGYMLMRQVRSRAPEKGGLIPAIALSAYAGEVNKQQALLAGFQMHLAKPVDPEALVRAIANLVTRSP